jgi:excisionase family DNA binding protein
MQANEPSVANSLMSVREVAAYLGIGRSTVYRLLRDGELPSIKVRAGRRFRRAAIERWVAAREAEGARSWRGEMASSKGRTGGGQNA